MSGVFGWQFEFDLVYVLGLGAELQGLGVGVAVVICIAIADVREVELAERESELGLFLGPVEEVGAGDVVGHGERLAGRGGVADLQIRDVAAHACVDVFDNALPLRFGNAAEDGAQHEFFVTAEGVVDVGFEFADVVYFAVDFGNFGVGHGGVGGRLLQVRRAAVVGDDERQLVAQCVGQQAEWGDFAGSVHPDFVFAHGQHGDDVIELRRRRDVGIELAAGVDEHRRGMQAFGFE